MHEKEVIVDAFPKSRTEMILGYIGAYQGRDLAQLRVVVPDAQQEGEWVRTHKGVAVDVTEFHKIVDALRRLDAVAANRAIGGRIAKSKNMEVRIYLEPFNGEVYCHVRTVFLKEDKRGKGVAVKADLLPSLIQLAEKIQKTIDARLLKGA